MHDHANLTSAGGGPLYSERLIDALGVAARLHAGQPPKATSIPYLAHLIGTCAIALEYGANEDQGIAALLHDAIEDVEPTEVARASVWRFGGEVGRIVEACTDSDSHPKPPWRERKERYLLHLADADRAVLLVSASDKLHNTRAIVADLRRVGEALWPRFSRPKEDTLWYYRELIAVFRANAAHPVDLVDEFDRTVAAMEALAR